MKKQIELFRLRLVDLTASTLKGHLGLFRRLLRHLKDQKDNWEGAYVQGYFYQGLEEIGISGGKPTGFRFKQYQVDDLLEGAEVLDIGSNTGFVAIYCAKFAKKVCGVELNPYLNRIARETSEYLQFSNTEFIDCDFADFSVEQKFDVVLSLSNHHTIDNNLDLGFEKHMQSISELLRPNGVLLFESHNVFGPGKGGIGDDGDMDEKILMMSKFFQIERYRMVKCFLKYGDVDKLFIVARKCDAPAAVDFQLERARLQYDWTIVQQDS